MSAAPDLAAILGALRETAAGIVAAYEPDAEAEDWIQFMAEDFAKDEPGLADLMQRAFTTRHQRARAWIAQDLIEAIDAAISPPRPTGRKLTLVVDNEKAAGEVTFAGRISTAHKGR